MGGGSLNPVKAIKKAVKTAGGAVKKIAGNGIKQVADIEDNLHGLGRAVDKYGIQNMPIKRGLDKMVEAMTPQMPDMTQPKDPYIAPDPEAVAQSRRRRNRGGAPTIMSSGSDTLGG